MSAQKKQPQRSTGQKRARQPESASGLLIDGRTKHDITGVAVTALSIALFITVLSDTSALVTRLVADTLRLGFGAGAYVLPFVVLLWGISFFVRLVELSEARIAAGLSIVFLAGIALRAVPESTSIPTADIARANGGYLGGLTAFAFTSLFDRPITYVILSAVAVIGLVVTGLSLSGLVDAMRDRLTAEPLDDEPEAKPKKLRAEKTRALLETEPVDAASAEKPNRGKRSGKDQDPEAGRKTAPVPPTRSPRALEGFVLPAFSTLGRTPESAARHRASEKELQMTAAAIEDTLRTFEIPSRVVGWVPGPTVTLFEVDIAKGIKVNKITVLADDLALALAASTIRILAPIPGKSLVGIEVPNELQETVTLGDILTPAGEGGPLSLGIGKDVSGHAVVSDLAAMPHLLIAGATGTGKSVCINALLISILMRSTPAEVRLILIDPKRIELSNYNGVPHLYVPVVTEPREAASALAWAVMEMERRLKVLQRAGARNIGLYNAMVQDGKLTEEAQELPYLVIVIDELADLMMVAAKEVEESICRIAQLARAAGIHLVVATQRPSADIITGLIKANITNRIAFMVGQSIDSRVILDQSGAEKLVGKGDMLYSTPAWPKPKRIQGAYVSEAEMEAVVEHLRNQGDPDYHEEILQTKVTSAAAGGSQGSGDEDPLLWDAAQVVVIAGGGSTSMLQRRLKLGYSRASRIMDMLEEKGIVGPPDGARPREVNYDLDGLSALRQAEIDDAEDGLL